MSDETAPKPTVTGVAYDPSKGLAGAGTVYFSDPTFESDGANPKAKPADKGNGHFVSHVASEPDGNGYRYFT